MILKYSLSPVPPSSQELHVYLLVVHFVFGSPESSADLAHLDFFFFHFIRRDENHTLSYRITFSHLNLDLFRFFHLNFFLILCHFHVTLTV